MKPSADIVQIKGTNVIKKRCGLGQEILLVASIMVDTLR